MTLHDEIIKVFEEDSDWHFSGSMARSLHNITGKKESNLERAFRELHSGYDRSGRWMGIYLDRKLVQIDGSGPWVTMYRIRHQPILEDIVKEPQEALF